MSYPPYISPSVLNRFKKKKKKKSRKPLFGVLLRAYVKTHYFFFFFVRPRVDTSFTPTLPLSLSPRRTFEYADRETTPAVHVCSVHAPREQVSEPTEERLGTGRTFSARGTTTIGNCVYCSGCGGTRSANARDGVTTRPRTEERVAAEGGAACSARTAGGGVRVPAEAPTCEYSRARPVVVPVVARAPRRGGRVGTYRSTGPTGRAGRTRRKSAESPRRGRDSTATGLRGVSPRRAGGRSDIGRVRPFWKSLRIGVFDSVSADETTAHTRRKWYRPETFSKDVRRECFFNITRRV